MKTLFSLLLVLGIGSACNSNPNYSEQTDNFDQLEQAQNSQPQIQKQPTKVEIYDQGLGMVMSTVTLPTNWGIQQDIAYNPNTGMVDRYKYVFIGPKNQYIRNYAGQFLYGSINGVPYEQAMSAAIDHVLGIEQLQNVQFQQLQHSESTMKDPRFQSMSQRLNSRGAALEAYEAQFSGQKNGKEYKGYIIFMNIINHNAGFGILTPTSMLFSPAQFYQEALDANKQIEQSRILNPQHDQAMAQISQQVAQRADAYSRQQMNQAAQAHQRRMADREAAFASHQKSMAGLNQLQDVAHENYMKTLQSNGSFTTVGSDYNSHSAMIDQTHERQSFNDPWAGTEIAIDGQYDYNYTNGLGDYYRTNDPSFDPNSLQGDWNKIEPLGP